MIYYIYHIVEKRKIGVSYDLKLRMSQHKWEGLYEILEEHTDIYEVSDREQELQREYGYPVDSKPYWKVVRDGEVGLNNVKYENRICFDREHQQHASAAGHIAKLNNGFYKREGKKKRKLTDIQVIDIRKKEMYQRDYAKKHNVSQRTVAQIQHKKTYIDVEDL